MLPCGAVRSRAGTNFHELAACRKGSDVSQVPSLSSQNQETTPLSFHNEETDLLWVNFAAKNHETHVNLPEISFLPQNHETNISEVAFWLKKS
jgi:hypothetical protein